MAVQYFGELYDTRYKMYGDELVEVMQSKYPIFNPDKIERPKKKSKVILESDQNSKSGDRAIRRAKHNIYDLAMCNPDCNMFVTLTLDKNKIDRYDYNIIVRKLNVWLDNKVRRQGLKYIMVAERHKDGAIHFHALFNDVLPKVDSGVKTKSDGTLKVVYNLPSWIYGFTTAIYTSGERAKVCNYIVKYITKSINACGIGGKVGGRWFYHGGNLSTPTYAYENTNFCSLSQVSRETFEMPIEGTNNVIRIYKV